VCGEKLPLGFFPPIHFKGEKWSAIEYRLRQYPNDPDLRETMCSDCSNRAASMLVSDGQARSSLIQKGIDRADIGSDILEAQKTIIVLGRLSRKIKKEAAL